MNQQGYLTCLWLTLKIKSSESQLFKFVFHMNQNQSKICTKITTKNWIKTPTENWPKHTKTVVKTAPKHLWMDKTTETILELH